MRKRAKMLMFRLKCQSAGAAINHPTYGQPEEAPTCMAPIATAPARLAISGVVDCSTPSNSMSDLSQLGHF